MIRGAVLGSPISHSLSPVLHKAIFNILGIEGAYSAIDVSSGSLAEFIASQGSEFDYLSLTMPLKEEVLGLEVATDELTQRIKSGNTLVMRDGRWSLTSTDGSGFISALAHANLHSFSSVLILGAGGTARAVAGALDAKTQNLHVLGRSSVREEALQKAIKTSHFEYYRWGIDIDFAQYDLVVNTTPSGAADLLTSEVHTGVQAALFDVIYKPWPTQLAQRWVDCGGVVVNGLELLLYQGIDQIEIVLEQKLERESIAQLVRPILAKAAR